MSDPGHKPDSKTTAERVIGSGVLIAAVPAVAYAMVFIHEYGFLSAFHVPAAFITVDTTSVFVMAASLCGTILILYYLGNILSILWPSRTAINRVRIMATVDVLLTLLGVLLIVLMPQYWKGFLYLLLSGPFLAFFDFVFPLITQRGKGTYRQKLDAQAKVEAQTNALVDRAAALLGWQSILVVCALAIVAGIMFFGGLYEAKTKKTFLVTETQDLGSVVVLREYHDHLICAPFDRDTKEVENSFFVLHTASESPRVLRLEDVGPLTAPNH